MTGGGYWRWYSDRKLNKVCQEWLSADRFFPFRTDALTWAACSKAAADPDSAQAVLAVAAREPVLVEDGPAKAMAMAVAALAVPVVAPR